MRSRLMLGGLMLVAALALSACQFTLPGRGAGSNAAPDQTVNPITGGAVEVTSLDAPPAAPVAGSPATTPPPPAQPAPEPAATPAQVAPEPAVVAAPKSPAQLACERKKGVWTQAGTTGAAFCQRPTRDGGKSCRASDDCEGYCLARSRTCAPITPMFGCQEILNDDGRMLTECLN